MIGNHLHEVEHVKRAVEFESDRVRWNHLTETLTAGACAALSSIAIQTGSSERCYS
jgi:hypothetical protein